MKDLRPLHFFLGIQVLHTTVGHHLPQEKYIANILEKCKIAGVKPAKTPLPASAKFSQNDGDPLPNAINYSQLVGSLQY